MFAVPDGARWSLPLYELAVMTARRLAAVLEYLEQLGIAFLPGSQIVRVGRGEAIAGSGPAASRGLRADRVVTFPLLRGPALAGVPHDANGFLPVDGHGAVRGVPDVYAVGDATDFPIKQGGIATQQADAVAGAIAARAGAPLTPAPFRPVLRGMLVTSERPHYLEADVTGAGGSHAADMPLWWPPAKIAAHHLAPYLAQRLLREPA